MILNCPNLFFLLKVVQKYVRNKKWLAFTEPATTSSHIMVEEKCRQINGYFGMKVYCTSFIFKLVWNACVGFQISFDLTFELLQMRKTV